MCQHQPPCPDALAPDRLAALVVAGPSRPREPHDRRCPARRTSRARDNAAYVGRLLSEKQPGFLAMLQGAERQVDAELSGESRGRRGVARVQPSIKLS
jgi:hypothetical protein